MPPDLRGRGTGLMTEELLRSIIEGYTLPWDGVHGLRHWGRVLETGRKLAESTGADLLVVNLFALFHDCRRANEEIDPGHGRRGGEFAGTLHNRGSLGLSSAQFSLLQYSCEHHTDGLVDADPTVQTCWDADRLDLGRVGITPEPRYLGTAAAKDPVMVAWAEGRSRSDHRPPVVVQWLAWIAPV